MARRFKMTGCARFFFAMLVIIPLAYFGAAFYNGENPIENLKNIFGKTNIIATENPTETEKPSDEILNLRSQLNRLNDEAEKKDEQINELYKEIEVLKKDLEEKADSIKTLSQ